VQETLDLPFRFALTSRSGSVYVTLQRLGIGGSAETYLVLATTGPHRGLMFALKLFRRLSKPEWRETFFRESTFLRRCDHPAVMRVFDEGTHLEGHPFTVAEYLPNTLAAEMHPNPATDRPLLKESLDWGMPRAYRTPDLVAYLRGGPPPTPKSDVFQLGLVLAELFTAWFKSSPFWVTLFGVSWEVSEGYLRQISL
jgi:hypothetical protein